MFACAMYPTENAFIQTVREEVAQQVSGVLFYSIYILYRQQDVVFMHLKYTNKCQINQNKTGIQICY